MMQLMSKCNLSALPELTQCSIYAGQGRAYHIVYQFTHRVMKVHITDSQMLFCQTTCAIKRHTSETKLNLAKLEMCVYIRETTLSNPPVGNVAKIITLRKSDVSEHSIKRHGEHLL